MIIKPENSLQMIEMSVDQPKQIETNTFKIYLEVLKKCQIQILNVILIHICTFAIFPTILVRIAPLDSLVEDRFFVPIFCFLLFNTFTAIGNIVAEKFLKPNASNLIYLVLARFLMVPFFLYCNFLPEYRKWPVLIRNDILYIIVSIIFSFTNGYTTSLVMMYTPKLVPESQSSISAMMASSAIIVGIIIGVQISMAFQFWVTI